MPKIGTFLFYFSLICTNFFIPHSQSVGYTGVSLSVRPFVVPISCVRNYSFIFLQILIIFGKMGGHDVRMRILYQFHVWLIFARVMALYAENWVHILCTQLVIYLWHILFIFGMMVGHDVSMRILYRFHGWLIFARVMAVYAPNWVCSCPFSYLVHATLHSSLDGFYL